MSRPAVPPRWILPALLLLAAGLRLLTWSRAAMMMNDGVDFLWQAEQLLAGDWQLALAHPYHPLYAALSAGVALLTGDLLGGALAVSIGSGVLLTATAWWLARRLRPQDSWLAPAAALLAAVNARAVQYGADVQSDGLAAALWLTGLTALLAAWQALHAHTPDAHTPDADTADVDPALPPPRPARPLAALALAGALTGLGYLTRPELLALGFPALLVVLAARGLAARARAAAAYALPLLALLLPYVLALHAETGTWGLSLKPSLQLAGLSSEPFVHQAPPGSPLGSPMVWRDRSRPPERSGRDDDEHPAEQRDAALGLLPDTGTGWSRASLAALDDFVHAARGEFLVLALVGLATLWRRASRLVALTFVAWSTWMAVVTAQLALVGYATNRHLLPAIVVLLPVAGAGVLRLARGGVLLRVLLALALLESVRAGTDDQRQDNRGRLDALAWIAEHTPPGARIATHRKRDGWYADRPVLVTEMPVVTADFARAVAEHDVRWLVFDRRRVQRYHPDWLTEGRVQELARFGTEHDDVDVVLVLEPNFGD